MNDMPKFYVWILVLLIINFVLAEEQPAMTGPYQEVVWSSDGNQLLITAQLDNSYQIFRTNPEGSIFTQLTKGRANNDHPSWSPDGKKIAFKSDQHGPGEIYVMDADGRKAIRLTTNSFEDSMPNWSPDGTQIAFSSKRNGKYQIYVMNSNGSEQKELTDGTLDLGPVWSPDGKTIAFYVTDPDEYDYIYLIHSDGSGRQQLARGSSPSWSPDGSKILFDIKEDVYLMNADGTAISRFIVDACCARYSPDGKEIAFIRGKREASHVFIGNDYGMRERKITGN